jgi:hypothetical protein
MRQAADVGVRAIPEPDGGERGDTGDGAASGYRAAEWVVGTI